MMLSSLRLTTSHHQQALSPVKHRPLTGDRPRCILQVIVMRLKYRFQIVHMSCRLVSALCTGMSISSIPSTLRCIFTSSRIQRLTGDIIEHERLGSKYGVEDHVQHGQA